MSNVHFMSLTNEWATPKETYLALDREFGFTLDPCCTHDNAKCALLVRQDICRRKNSGYFHRHRWHLKYKHGLICPPYNNGGNMNRLINMDYYPNDTVTLLYSDGTKETLPMIDVLIRDVEQKLAIRKVQELIKRRGRK